MRQTLRMIRYRPAFLCAALALLACGCGAGTVDGDGVAGDRRLTVLAAASLTDVFAELGERFEDDTGARVDLSLGSSTDLAGQAADGAPGDVLATADTVSMAVAEDAGVTSEVSELATNTLVVVTRPGNPRGIDSLGDLAGTSWVRCADPVPCGRAAVEMLDAAGVTAEPTSLEDDARATLDKVTSGEVDAGLVYSSDAVAAGDAVVAVEVPEAADATTTYAVAVLEQAAHPDLAQEWVDLLLSDEGRQVLHDAGFTTGFTTGAVGR